MKGQHRTYYSINDSNQKRKSLFYILKRSLPQHHQHLKSVSVLVGVVVVRLLKCDRQSNRLCESKKLENTRFSTGSMIVVVCLVFMCMCVKNVLSLIFQIVVHINIFFTIYRIFIGNVIDEMNNRSELDSSKWYDFIELIDVIENRN